MSGKVIGFGVVLLVAVAGGVWLMRDGPAAESRRTAVPVDRSGIARAEPARPAPARIESSGSGNGGAGAVAPDSAGSSAARTAAPGTARPASPVTRDVEFISKLFSLPGPDASDAERQAWEESPIADLLYPPDHPCAGLPLDSVSAPVLEAAANGTLGKMLDNVPDVDREQCHLQGRWPFFSLNQAYSGVDRENPETVVAFLDRLAAIPQDPKAYPADIWLPCSGHPDATTMRAYFQGMVREKASEVLAGPRCNAR